MTNPSILLLDQDATGTGRVHRQLKLPQRMSPLKMKRDAARLLARSDVHQNPKYGCSSLLMMAMFFQNEVDACLGFLSGQT